MVKDKFIKEDPEANRIWQEMINELNKPMPVDREDAVISEKVFKKRRSKCRRKKKQ
jgi:hypothetical protein